MYRIVAIALLSAFLILVLKEMGFKGARLVSAVATVTVLFYAMQSVKELFSGIEEAARIGGVTDVSKNIMKIIGIGYIYGIASDICNDLGENGVASALKVAGRVEILLVCIPFVTRIIGTAADMLS